MDIESRIRNGRMTGFQAATVFICMLTIISDGYDILSVALTVPFMAEEWELSATDIGYVISASTAGMVIGALVLAPLGDRFGRRLMGLVGQALITLGMFLSWLAPGFELLLGARFITGIGIGAVTAVMGVIVAEFSTKKWLGFNMALYSAGTGLGGFVAGMTAQSAIPAFGWKSVFLIGAVINLFILVICLVGLPESIQYLSTRSKGRNQNLERINRLLSRMGREPIADLPAARQKGKKSPGTALRDLLSRKMIVVTIFLASSFCLMMGWFYFNLGWTPQLITTATSDPALGTLFGTLAPLGGMIGGLLYGVVSLKVPNKQLTMVSLAVTAAGAGLLGFFMAQQDIPLYIPLTMAIGFGAALGGVYALIPECYPTQIRASAFGWISGFGRIAATVGPILAGYLVEGGWTGSMLFLGSGAVLAVAAVLLFPIRAHQDTTGAVAGGGGQSRDYGGPGSEDSEDEEGGLSLAEAGTAQDRAD